VTTLFPPLFPLRIPSGWAVIFNIFVDLSTSEEINKELADRYLSDDILSIEQVRLVDGRWQTISDGAIIDLSWTKPGDPNGLYSLNILRGNWDEPVAEFRHHDGQQVAMAIERVFKELIAGRTIPEISQVFATMQGSGTVADPEEQ
jgi:hypothetical protein